MGQAKLKSVREGEVVKFDFQAPDLHLMKGDRVWLAKSSDGTADESRVQERATRFTISNVVQAAHPQGMDRRDGKIWADWLGVLDEESGTPVEVTRGMVEWLSKQMSKEDVKVPIGLAGWREAVVDYLDKLLAE